MVMLIRCKFSFFFSNLEYKRFTAECEEDIGLVPATHIQTLVALPPNEQSCRDSNRFELIYFHSGSVVTGLFIDFIVIMFNQWK